MSENVPMQKVIIHTDVLLDFLTHKGSSPSILREAAQKFFCYTTVFNAIELFSFARTARERTAVEDAMRGMKILGMNAKSAKRSGTLLAGAKNLSIINAMVACLAFESKLPILTRNPQEFRGVKGLDVLSTGMLRRERRKRGKV